MSEVYFVLLKKNFLQPAHVLSPGLKSLLERNEMNACILELAYVFLKVQDLRIHILFKECLIYFIYIYILFYNNNFDNYFIQNTRIIDSKYKPMVIF